MNSYRGTHLCQHRQAIAALFPFEASVSAIVLAPRAPAPQTAAQLSEARREEFNYGRLCVRRALAGFGISATAGRRPSGAPHWPAGIVGAISHTRGLCAAIIARTGAARALGLDVERRNAAPSELRALIMAPGEEIPIGVFGAETWLTAVFSAKEAFYKCHFPVHEKFLAFRDWRTAFRAQTACSGWFTIRPATGAHAPFAGIGRWCCDETYIYTGFSAPACADGALTGLI